MPSSPQPVLRHKLGQQLRQLLLGPQTPSPESQQWRDGLIRQRFWVGIGLALLYISIAGITTYYEYFVNPERLLWALDLLQVPDALSTLRQDFILHKILVALSLLTLVVLWRSPFIRKRPAIMLLLLPWALTFIPEIVLGAVLGVPHQPSSIMFLAQAIIIPVYWRIHLLAQLVPIAFYFGAYPLLGLTHFGEQPIHSFGYAVELILICIICELGVHLFETTKQSEVEANLRLQCCVHSITHDLRTPVMGSLLLLRSLQNNTLDQQPIQIAPQEMTALMNGGERLLSLMDTLMVPDNGPASVLILRRQSVDITEIFNTVLDDFREVLAQRNIQIDNRIPANTPKVYVDPCQIGRVLSNLIDNAVRYNPPQTQITLQAKPVTVNHYAMLKVMLVDNGQGLVLGRQNRIFEPYVRGTQSQYQPGRGLGLYICKQVIQAHEGQIGIEPAHGTAVWFTLPR
ncbi:MAG: ATP-binding protein [Cyanobacteria bacterium J06632_22]